MASAKQLFSGLDIRCMRGGRIVFENLSFSLPAGGILHLAGANGAGKSSLLRILAGMLPYSGKVMWGGVDFLENGVEAHASRLSFLPQDDRSLKAQETVAETLAFWAAVSGGGDVAASLAAMGLSALADVPVRHLSAGQKRRLTMARVILKPAPLWLLDEPLNGMDDQARTLFWQAVDAHVAADGMVIVACHDWVAPRANLQRLEMG